MPYKDLLAGVLTAEEARKHEETLTDAEVAQLPLEEQIQIALSEALGEDVGEDAWDVVEPFLAKVWREGWKAGRPFGVSPENPYGSLA